MSGEPQQCEFQTQRANLRRQLEARRFHDLRVLDVIERTRRDRFVPEELQSKAYDDTALPIGHNQTISQPYIVALMTEAIVLGRHETVLEIGTGSGYQTAILAQLCRSVVTVERISELSRAAEGVLASLGFRNIEFRIGDGTLGCPEREPYDGILVTAASPHMPEPLYDQLNMDGRMVIPVGDESVQTLKVIEKREPKPKVTDLGGCRFVKLIGKTGWPISEAVE